MKEWKICVCGVKNVFFIQVKRQLHCTPVAWRLIAQTLWVFLLPFTMFKKASIFPTFCWKNMYEEWKLLELEEVEEQFLRRVSSSSPLCYVPHSHTNVKISEGLKMTWNLNCDCVKTIKDIKKVVLMWESTITHCSFKVWLEFLQEYMNELEEIEDEGVWRFFSFTSIYN